jgi:hypothetical protein
MCLKPGNELKTDTDQTRLDENNDQNVARFRKSTGISFRMLYGSNKRAEVDGERRVVALLWQVVAKKEIALILDHDHLS